MTTQTTDVSIVPLDVILYQRGPYWVGHCLQLDLLTSGTDPQIVREDIVRICVAQVKYAYANSLLDNLFRPANKGLQDRILKGLDEGGLALQIISEVVESIDHRNLHFRVLRAA